MPEYFQEFRNVELSTLYYLEQNLNTDWPGTTTVKTFKEIYHKDIDLPIVCAILDDTASDKREVGSTTLDHSHLLVIDIFSRSNGQRLDMANYITDKLALGWIHYDHSQASGGGFDRVENGRDMVTSFISNQKIDVGESVDTKDKYRHRITIRVRNS